MSILVASLLMQVALAQSVGGSGACKGAADQKVWEGGVKRNISAVQMDCILKGAPGAAWYDHCIKHFMKSPKDGESCMTDCVEKRTQLSAPCSQCFGEISRCTYEHCISSCIDSSSPACIACGTKYCTSDFVNCSGITDLPHVSVGMPYGLPDSLKKMIHNFTCKELENSSTKEKVVTAVCSRAHHLIKILPEGACENIARLVWEHEELRFCKPAVAKAAEFRRWEGSSNCTGTYSILSTDNMNECTPYLIPAPASIWVEQKNDTAYSSYHCQGVTDCTKEKRKFLSDWIVGTCDNYGDYSQMRVWISKESPQPLLVV